MVSSAKPSRGAAKVRRKKIVTTDSEEEVSDSPPPPRRAASKRKRYVDPDDSEEEEPVVSSSEAEVESVSLVEEEIKGPTKGKAYKLVVEIPPLSASGSPASSSRPVTKTNKKKEEPIEISPSPSPSPVKKKKLPPSKTTSKPSTSKPTSKPSSLKKKKKSVDSDSDFQILSAQEDEDDFVLPLEEEQAEKSEVDEEPESEAESVVSLVEKKNVKKKAASKKSSTVGGLTAAARKKAATASADAGNLPPMSDLASMFRDMITRVPGSSSGSQDAIVEEDEPKLESPEKGGAKKQTTLFGFMKPQPVANGSSSKNTKGKSALVDQDGKGFGLAKGVYLAKAVKKLGGRKLRVATMCSGTESPLLALGLISREVKAAYGVPFDVEHVFSCELEPYKQAYIERNFAPPILFRDVTELGNEFATTAYGASVKVPGNVDLLVAGTSCVDYSNLNNSKKGLEQKGESGNTFRGMYNWVINHRPMIVVLENVCSAPWGAVAEKFEEIGYSAIPHKFDTKDFYIPHTRTRGYLVAFRQPEWPNKAKGKRSAVDSLPEEWVDMVNSMQRPASSPLEAFLLPPNDPRLHQGRLELAAAKGLGKARAPTDWGRCASRHEKCRFEEGLGTKRPWTDWRDGAICNFPEGYWNDWANAQTERVQDLTDVSHLRAARNGFDAAFRTLVWNLSQNVDREIGSAKRPGIVPCMTPTMIPYVTNRGGPLIGIEALALQGIPADELLLTRETEDQLADLAGNAMSSTVVGTCMVAAIILSTKYLEADDENMEIDEQVDVVDAAIAVVGDDIQDRIVGQDQLSVHALDLAKLSDVPVAEILTDAAKSARYCLCEGPTGTSTESTLICSSCRHTRCAGCSNRPLHDYALHPYLNHRIGATVFARRLKSVLPMRLEVEGFTKETLEQLKKNSKAVCDSTDWALWSKLVVKNLHDTEFHFKLLDRKHQWNAVYDAPGASLRLTLNEGKAVWLLFVKAPISDNANARRRQLAAHPVARLIVKPTAKNLLDGEWSIQLPTARTFKVDIQGTGELVPAWEARVGLQQLPEQDSRGNSIDKVKWQEKKQWTSIEVSVPEKETIGLDVDITGTYQLHHNCGTAMESLHIKDGDLPVSFFLDPVRVGFAPDDPFVFALDHERLDYEQERVAIAKLDPLWRPTGTDARVTVKAKAHGLWTQASEISMAPIDAAVAEEERATYSIPERTLAFDVSGDACTHANALLVCKVPLPHAQAEHLWRSVQNSWGEIELQHKGKQAFEALAWITERLPALDSLSQWSSVPLGNLHHDEETTCCKRCAPPPPDLSWMMRMNRLIPVEDVVQAGEYERALKRRPAPLVAQMRLDGSIGTIQIGLNIATLLHRALSRLPFLGRTHKPELSWRLQTDYQAVETAFFRPSKLALKSNRDDKQAEQPPNFGTKSRDPKLRPEQLRSLTWMLQQEAEKDHSFVEEEVAEATLGPLGWRAEGRASRKVMVRGGVLADQVGYGKTAISLALIDTSNNVEEHALPNVPRPGRITTKATLIVVPPHLTKQWEGEITKFLPRKNYKVVKLLDLTSINSVSIRDIKNADIVIVALSIFKSQLYWSNLAGFAASGSLPNGDLATRHFVSRLDQVLEGLDAQVKLLLGEDGPAQASKKIKKSLDKIGAERKAAKDTRDEFIMTYGKKRLTGAAYLAMQEGEIPTKAAPKAKKAKVERDDREANDPWNLNNKHVHDNYEKMRSPPLHMFRFNRVIIDEFTYVDQRCLSAVTKLESVSTWVLSGTPPVSDFTAVKGIADFLHVHLGVDDDTEGTADTTKRRQKGQTAAEAFHSFREVHTASWHAARYGVAQRFLDTFVRQNVAEIGEIHSEERVVAITLPAAEHAIYLELDHHIHSLQGMTKKIMKSAKGARADRQMRLSDALGNSSDPREALIKRCAHFDMESEGSVHDAFQACERIVKTRTKQRRLCEEDLHYTISEAIQLYLYIRDVKKGYKDPKTGDQERKTSHFAEYLKTTFGEAGNGDKDATALHRKIVTEEGCEWVKGDIKIDKEKHQAVLKSRKPREDEDGNTKVNTKLKEDELKWQLREKSHVLRRLANELVGRTRSLRYFTAVRDVQRNGDAALPPCVKCQGESKGEPCILSACGHTGCFDCLSPLAMHGFECPHEGCRINLETHQVIPTKTLGREEKSGHFGAKLLQLVAIIKFIEANDSTDRILIFVQFDDLLNKIRLALKAARVGTIVIEGSATKQANELDRFQNLDVDDPNSERVLILNVAAASASGANLTLANHVIFVHPVHYSEASHDRFIATETQAIGRIRRYGQEKRCYIWRLLTANAVDEIIMTERTGSKPVGNWNAIEGNDLDTAIELLPSDNDQDDNASVAPKRRVKAKAKAGGKRKKAEASEDGASAAESWADSD